MNMYHILDMDSIYATPSTMYNNHDVQIRLKAVCRSYVQQYIGGLKCRLFTGVAVSQRMHIGEKPIVLMNCMGIAFVLINTLHVMKMYNDDYHFKCNLHS